MAKLIASLGWPHVALIFVVIFIFVFRRAISSFLSRIKSVSKTGVSTDTLPVAQTEDKRKQAVQDLMNIGDTPLILEAEEAIRKTLAERGLETTGDTNTVLIRHLAVTQIALDFEQIHGLLFGSQIYLLKKLNEVTGSGLSPEFVQGHFIKVQDIFAPQLNEWDLRQYLAFLFSSNLITHESENYHITVKGVDFLIWMAKTGHREDNPL